MSEPQIYYSTLKTAYIQGLNLVFFHWILHPTGGLPLRYFLNFCIAYLSVFVYNVLK